MATDATSLSRGTAASPVSRRRAMLRVAIRVALAPVVVVLVATVIVPQFGDAARAWQAAGAVSPSLMTAGVVLELISIASSAQLTRWAFPSAVRPRYGTTLRANLVAFGLGNTLPLGNAPSVAARLRILGRAGSPVGAVAGAIVLEGVVSYQVLSVIFGVGLLGSLGLLAGVDAGAGAAGAPPGLTWTLGIAGMGLFVAAAIGLVVVTLLRVPAVRLLRRLARPLGEARSDAVAAFAEETLGVIAAVGADRRRLAMASFWSAVNWLADAAALAVLLAAFGNHLPIPSLLVAYGLASILGTLPLTPGGVGIVEGVLVPVLIGLGVTAGGAVLGVTAWRLVQFWMPIPIAGVAAATLLRGSRLRPPARSAARPSRSDAADERRGRRGVVDGSRR